MRVDDENRAPLRLQGTTFWLLGRASRVAFRITQQRLAEVGLRRGFYGVLASIVEFGPAAQADIGRRLGIDRSDMVAILNDLEQEGFVTRERDTSDRRRNSITVTRAGRGALVRFDRAIADAEDVLLESFSAGDRRQLVGLLERVVASTGAEPVTPSAAAADQDDCFRPDVRRSDQPTANRASTVAETTSVASTSPVATGER